MRSSMRVLKLPFVVLNNNSDAFFHSISPMKAFSPEKVNFMIWLLNTFTLGHRFEFCKLVWCRSHGSTFIHKELHRSQAVPRGPQGS